MLGNNEKSIGNYFNGGDSLVASINQSMLRHMALVRHPMRMESQTTSENIVRLLVMNMTFARRSLRPLHIMSQDFCQRSQTKIVMV